MSRRALKIGLLAVAGLLVAAALGVAASRITSENVGLYGQPPSVGRDLASGPVHVPGQGARRHRAKSGDEGGKAQQGAGDDTTVETEEPAQAEEPEPPEFEEDEPDDD